MVDYRFIKNNLLNVLTNLIILSRFETIRFLSTNNLSDKLRVATSSFEIIKLSKNLKDFLNNSFNSKIGVFSYGNLNPGKKKIIQKHVNLGNLIHQKKAIKKSLFLLIEDLIKLLDNDFNSFMFLQPIEILEEIKSSLNEKSKINSIKLTSYKVYKEKVKKILTGPVLIGHDNIFSPTYNALDEGMVSLNEDLENNIEYYWNLALREEGAANLCALSVIEYDYLPFDFYYDLTCQMWDEIRHANNYLKLSLYLLESNYKLISDKNFIEKVSVYKKYNRFPVLKEFNFYQSIFNASLEERLILMNILTEAKAIGRISNNINKNPFVKKNTYVKAALTFDRNDEINHGKNGYKWLKFLLPIEKDRKDAIEDTKLLRGFLIASTLSSINQNSLELTLNNFINN